MIVVKLQGGLGNQMFQYATARHLGIKYKKEIILNTEYFSNIPKDDVPRKYQLYIFNVDKNIKTENTSNMVLKFTQKIILKLFSENTLYNISEIFLRFNLPVYLSGYFQSEKYFKGSREIILKELSLTRELGEEAEKIKNIIEKSEAVCLNVRRGDYLRPDYMKIYGACSTEYYNKAIEYIKNKIKNPLICVFSDDPEWVRKEFNIENVVFAGNDVLKDYEQMYLMSLCKHNIIANSSFAWWGAWLNQNPNKIIIAPQKWFNIDSPPNIVPESWVRI